jgi:hypothetical protein
MGGLLDQSPSFLDLGRWTNGLIIPLFQLFKNDNVAPALASSILLVAVLLCVLFLIESFYIRAQIRRRTRAIKLVRREDFVDALPKIERRMLASGYLRHSWQKFRETLIEPTGSDSLSDKLVRNTERPQSYFNMSEAGLRFPLYRAMPNLLVGIGLLLTFVGLVTALYFTTEALNSAHDLDASQEALKNLLHAASFKFYTSVAGLGGSILLTVVLKYGMSKVEDSFDNLASVLESKVLFVTPESIAFDHYREAKEQTRNLKLFNTEIAISVGRHIEEALAATLPRMLEQVMVPIGQTLSDVANKMNSKSENAIGEMAGSFVDRLQGATGEQMQRLADTLGDLRLSIDNINNRMNESGSGLADNVAKSTQDLQVAIGMMTTALGEMTSKAARDVEGGSSTLNRHIETAAATLESVSNKIAEILRDSANRMTGGSEQASAAFATELTQATTKFHEASDRTAARIEEAIAAISEKLVGESGEIGKQIARAAVEAGNESRAKVASAGIELAQTFSDMGNQLAAGLSRLQDGLNGTVQRISEIERGIAQHVGSIVQLSKATEDTGVALSGTARSIREAGAPLSESARLLADASRNIADATGSTQQSVLGAQAEIRNITLLLQQTLEATSQQWQNYERRFKGVDDSLGIILDRIIKSVQENLEGLRSFVEKVDEKLSGAVDKLGGGISDLGEFAQSIEQITLRLNRTNLPDAAQ